MIKRSNTQEFIVKAVKVHKDFYDYSLSIYKNSKTKLIIICPAHGEFLQTPSAHLRGNGCASCSAQACGDRFRLSLDQFIEKSKKTHGNKYDYSTVSYISGIVGVNIICPIHGTFNQRPSDHIKRSGCPECGLCVSKTACCGTTEDFIKRSNEVHLYRYDYSQTKYITSQYLVDIICNKHGVFSQLPYNHLSGSGCPSCAVTGFKQQVEGFVYILESDDMFKVGITNNSISRRVSQLNVSSPQRFKSVFYRKMQGEIANTVETGLLRWLRGLGLRKPSEKFEGFSECFYKGNITLTSIIDKLCEFERELTNG